jgi:ATP-dependent DNA helicase RecG
LEIAEFSCNFAAQFISEFMTFAQLQDIIRGGENISVEFKKCPAELNHSVFETVCSFLNRTGGHLILGVADNGEITGVKVNCIDSMIKNFINTVNNPELLNPTFYFSPEVFTVADRKIIYIYIPESSQVHRYRGEIYDRAGDADNDITGNHYLINNIYIRKNRNFTENEVLPYLEVADLDSETFRKARRLAGVWVDNHPWLTMDDAEMLHSCGLWQKDSQTGREGYTLAAALLFGRENTVLSCCPAYKTDAIYRNMSYGRFMNPHSSDPDVRYDDRDDIRVNLIEAYQRLMTFINRNLPDKFHLEGIQRIDIRDRIFREIAANMLIHREYAHSFPAKFLIFSDRVVTENWTKPAGEGNVTLDSLETHPKNPMIARVFKELGWVEELGSGRKNIKKYAPYYFSGCQIAIANEEKFVFSITYRNVDIIPESEHVNFESEHATAKSEHVNPENEHVNLIPTTAQINSIYTLIDENVTGNINEPVKQSIFKIISYLLLNNSGANGNTLAIMLGKRRSSLTRHLKLLRDANIIEFVGSDKTGGYYLTKQAKERL